MSVVVRALRKRLSLHLAGDSGMIRRGIGDCRLRLVRVSNPSGLKQRLFYTHAGRVGRFGAACGELLRIELRASPPSIRTSICSCSSCFSVEIDSLRVRVSTETCRLPADAICFFPDSWSRFFRSGLQLSSARHLLEVTHFFHAHMYKVCVQSTFSLTPFRIFSRAKEGERKVSLRSCHRIVFWHLFGFCFHPVATFEMTCYFHG